MLGGIVAAAILDALTPGALGVTARLGTGVSRTQGLFIEMFATAALCIVVLMMAAGTSIPHCCILAEHWASTTFRKVQTGSISGAVVPTDHTIITDDSADTSREAPPHSSGAHDYRLRPLCRHALVHRLLFRVRQHC